MEPTAVKSAFIHVYEVFYLAGVDACAIFEAVDELTWIVREVP
jgi:hypothetical protein